ncbi:MAG: LysR family transcriptional regulator [Acidiferrobacterales bacterium]|nr:LysR family transcriptional regulator [Acidiferrobacterales bacterium]
MSEFTRQLPPLSTLVVFDSAARLKSFSQAADECALSQASVSRQMKQLEDNLELSLFERHRYDVSLTEAGERLHATVQRALGELAATATELRETAQGKSSLTIYSNLSIGTDTLAPLVGRFQTLFPDVKFNILSSYEPIEKTRSSFDIGFQVGRRAENYFDVETIADDIVFPVCSQEFAKQFKSKVTADKLSALPLLHLEYENKSSIGWQQFLSNYRIRQKKPTERLVFSSYQVCLDVAERGDGVALGWGRSVSSRIDEGKLVRFTDMSLHISDGINVYLRKHIAPHPLAAEVINVVRANIKDINDYT